LRIPGGWEEEINPAPVIKSSARPTVLFGERIQIFSLRNPYEARWEATDNGVFVLVVFFSTGRVYPRLSFAVRRRRLQAELARATLCLLPAAANEDSLSLRGVRILSS